VKQTVDPPKQPSPTVLEEDLNAKEALQLEQGEEKESPSSLIHNPDKSQKKCTKPHIGMREEAPEWLVDNKFISRGYRIGFYRVRDVLKSLFMCHNETTNVWSHLIGVILFYSLIFYIVFFVGGMEFTRPLDNLINKFDFINFKFSKYRTEITTSYKDSQSNQGLLSNASSQEYINASVDLWHKSVELENPFYFNLEVEKATPTPVEGENQAAPVFQTQASLEAQLYDTSLDYLLLIIQKFSTEKIPENTPRENLYEVFKKIQPILVDRLDQAIEKNKNSFEKKIGHLANVKRSVNYHFNSENVKKLIITGDLKDNYSKVHEITRIPLYVHMIAAIICLSFSSFFHLFAC